MTYWMEVAMVFENCGKAVMVDCEYVLLVVEEEAMVAMVEGCDTMGKFQEKSLVMKESERDCDTMKLENVNAAHTKLHYSGSIEQI